MISEWARPPGAYRRHNQRVEGYAFPPQPSGVRDLHAVRVPLFLCAGIALGGCLRWLRLFPERVARGDPLLPGQERCRLCRRWSEHGNSPSGEGLVPLPIPVNVDFREGLR